MPVCILHRSEDQDHFVKVWNVLPWKQRLAMAFQSNPAKKGGSELPQLSGLGAGTWKSAMAVRFSSDANTSHGPIIHPRLVGHASTPPGSRSKCAHASTPHRSGVVCVHGIALGSPGHEHAF